MANQDQQDENMENIPEGPSELGRSIAESWRASWHEFVNVGPPPQVYRPEDFGDVPPQIPNEIEEPAPVLDAIPEENLPTDESPIDEIPDENLPRRNSPIDRVPDVPINVPTGRKMTKENLKEFLRRLPSGEELRTQQNMLNELSDVMSDASDLFSGIEQKVSELAASMKKDDISEQEPVIGVNGLADCDSRLSEIVSRLADVTQKFTKSTNEYPLLANFSSEKAESDATEKPEIDEESENENERRDEFLRGEIESYVERQERIRFGQASQDELKRMKEFECRMHSFFKTSSIGNSMKAKDAERHKNVYFNTLISKVKDFQGITPLMCRGIELLATYQSDVLVWDAGFLHFIEDPRNSREFPNVSEALIQYVLTIFSDI